MTLFWAVLLLPVGIVLLVKGANWLVDGAVAAAERLGITPLVIGLTVVAMGTSAPEVAASIAAALTGSGDIAVGNVYGSNIANLALVGGLCAVFRPILVHRAALRRDIPLMLASAGALWVVLHDAALTRSGSAVLMILFTGILVWMVHSERRRAVAEGKVEIEIQAKIEQTTHRIPQRIGVIVLLIATGLICLGVGAHLTVLSASAIGRIVGISEAVIGLTIVAVGTSLPELTTCVVASFRGQDDLSIGNLVGSNIFNTLLVIGAAGLAKPFTVSPRLAGMDFWLMAAVSVVFAVFAFTFRRISRQEGLTLFIGYCGYIAWLFLQSR